MSGINSVKETEELLVSKNDDNTLARRAKAGDLQARETLILKNLSHVNRLLGKFSGKGVPDDVLYQEGCYGLIMGIDKYDPDRGASLGTYVSFYIDKYLHLAMMDNRPHPITIKYKATRNAKKYKNAVDALVMENGKTPSIQEIAEYLGISYEETTNIMNCTTQAVSFDDAEYLSIHTSAPDAETVVLEKLNEMCLDEFPVALTKREKQVLHLRFGFGEKGRPHSFVEIGEIMGICDDTVSSICRDALKKLRISIVNP